MVAHSNLYGCLFFSGDIYALTSGERVSSGLLGALIRFSTPDIVEYAQLSPGVLYWTFPLCCLAIWNPHSSGERDSITNNHKKKGPGQYLGVICVLKTQVFYLKVYGFDFKMKDPIMCDN
jgi:hypothetical protein